MKLMFNSSDKRFLEFFNPEITFEDDVFLAETEQTVLDWLDDFGLTKEDVKEAGLKIMKNKITIPKGTTAIVLDTGNGETSLRIKDIEFDCYLSYQADYAYVEVEALDKERENTFNKYKAGSMPNDSDKTMFYDFYLINVVEAMNALRFDDSGKRYAFEACKTLSKDEVSVLMHRYLNRELARINGVSDIRIASASVEDYIDPEIFNILKDPKADFTKVFNKRHSSKL